MQTPQNINDQTATDTQAAIARLRAISDSEKRLARAIDAAAASVDAAELTDIVTHSQPPHSQEDAFAPPAEATASSR